jgi:transposase InsO family protein
MEGCHHPATPGSVAQLPKRDGGANKRNFEDGIFAASPKNLADAVRMVDESVLIYNAERPHLALKHKTPDAVHRAF